MRGGIHHQLGEAVDEEGGEVVVEVMDQGVEEMEEIKEMEAMEEKVEMEVDKMEDLEAVEEEEEAAEEEEATDVDQEEGEVEEELVGVAIVQEGRLPDNQAKEGQET